MPNGPRLSGAPVNDSFPKSTRAGSFERECAPNHTGMLGEGLVIKGIHESGSPRPNEKRLSCAAVLCYSQKQFYYEGRRQLQPLVRQTRDDTEPSLYPHDERG